MGKAVYDIPFRNDSGEEIPPFAVLRVDGIVDRDGQWVKKVFKPDDTYRLTYLVNGPAKIPVGGFGDATDGRYPCIVAKETGTFAFEDAWGIANNSWTLHRWTPGGFFIQAESGTGKGLFERRQQTTLYGQLNDDLNYQGTAEVQLYNFESPTVQSDSGVKITANDGFLKSGKRLPDNSRVLLTLVGSLWVATLDRVCPTNMEA